MANYCGKLLPQCTHKRAYAAGRWLSEASLACVIILSKAITNVPIHTNGSAQMQYCAVVDEGNFVRLGRFNGTCTSAKIHLEAQEAIIMSKLSAMSSVNYVYEITVSIFVKIQPFPSIVLQRKHFSGERFIVKQWKRCHSFT